MKVIGFILLLLNWRVDNNAKITTKGCDDFDFVINPKETSYADTDTTIHFDGGISFNNFIKYVAMHNMENYAMYTSTHKNFCNYSSDDIDIHKNEVIVK